MKYFIENITDKYGNTRKDGRYPKRIGSTITFLSGIQVGDPAYFRYVKYNNGELVEDHVTRTSCVTDFDDYSDLDKTYLYTRNSIYILKKINE